MKNKSQYFGFQVPLDLNSVEEPAQVYTFPEKIRSSNLDVDQQLEAIAQTPEGINAIFNKSCELVDQRFGSVKKVVFDSPEKARIVLKARMAHLPHEEFGILVLDNRHREIAFEVVARGTIDSASVHPREVVKAVLKHNGAACVLCHNHPSGDSSPSAADKQVTKIIKTALETIDVRVLDHIIVGEGEPYSFAENRLLGRS